MHWFPFYVAEYLSDSAVVKMTPEQRGCFISLLCHAWQSGSPGTLPDDDATLARLAGVSLRRWMRIKDAILAAWENQRTTSLFHRRLLEEFEKARIRSQRLSEAGKAGLSKRWHSQAIARLSPANSQATKRLWTTTTTTTTTNTPPTPPEGGGAGEAAPRATEPLDEPPARQALRAWIAARNDLLWSMNLEKKLAPIWEHPLGGPDAVGRLVRIAVESGAADVGAYAAAIFSRELASRASDGQPPPARRGEWVSNW